jgi:hypothetical protein
MLLPHTLQKTLELHQSKEEEEVPDPKKAPSAVELLQRLRGLD